MARMLAARLGRMRLGASRLAYVVAVPLVTVAGVNRTSSIRLDGLTITDELDHEPNNASFRCDSAAPTVGQEIKIYAATGVQLFGGHVLSVAAVYEGEKNTLLAWDVHAIDYTWLLGRRKVTAKYTAASASTVLLAILAGFTSGFTGVHVTPGLPVLDEITFTNDDVADAFSRIMERVGGYWYIDNDRDLHAFYSDDVAAGAITQAAPRTMSGIRTAVDFSQVATRVLARGGGANASVPVLPGANTLPVDDQSWYAPAGGVVECGPQRISYAGVGASVGLGGLVVGASGGALTAPTPTVNAAVGGNLLGTYSYKVTAVLSGGESLPSAASGSVLSVSACPPGPTLSLQFAASGFDWPLGNTAAYKVAFVTSAGVGGAGAASATISTGSGTGASAKAITISNVAIGPAGTIARKLYRSVNGGPFWSWVTFAEEYAAAGVWDTNTATTDLDQYWPQGTNRTQPLPSGAQIELTGIATGPAGTTARRIYRTRGSGTGAYFLCATIAGNVTTTFTDNVADSALGDEAPAASTVPTLAGATTIAVADLSVFPASGWLDIGSQLIRYTGRSGSSGPGTLTGVPTTGDGAILAPISVGASAASAPHLSGVTGIVFAIAKGDPVNVLVTVNDTTAQAAAAAYVGSGDGVHEHFITDGRWSRAEAASRAQTELDLLKHPNVTVSFQSRDQSLQSGRSVTIALTSPALTGTFKIQRVTLTAFGVPRLPPTRAVECSSKRFSFEDLLRQIRKGSD